MTKGAYFLIEGIILKGIGGFYYVDVYKRQVEGCLSVPGVYGYVTRPTWAKIGRAHV